VYWYTGIKVSQAPTPSNL